MALKILQIVIELLSDPLVWTEKRTNSFSIGRDRFSKEKVFKDLKKFDGKPSRSINV